MNHRTALTTPAQNMQYPAFSTTVPLAQTHPISWDMLGTCGDCRARVRAQPDPALSRALRPMGRVRPKAPGLWWLFLEHTTTAGWAACARQGCLAHNSFTASSSLSAGVGCEPYRRRPGTIPPEKPSRLSWRLLARPWLESFCCN